MTTAPRLRSARAGAVPDLVSALVSASLLGGALVHTLVVREHLEEWLPAGLFFVALVLLETLLAVLSLRRWSTGVAVVVLASNLATVAVWLLSRTAGLPIGPESWTPEPIGLPDVACCALELAGAAICAVALSRRSTPVGLHPVVAVLGAVAVVVVTGVGVQQAVAGQGAHHHAPAAAPRASR